MNRLENFASAWRQKAWRCFRHAQLRRLSLIRALQSCSAVGASDIWDIYVSLGPLDWLTDWQQASRFTATSLAIVCVVLMEGLPLAIERLLWAVRSPTRPGASLSVWPPPQCQPVTATGAAKTPLVLQSLSPLAHVRHNLPAPAWPGQCQGSGFTRGAH